MQDLTDGEGRVEGVTRKGMGELTNYLVNFSRKLLWKFKKWSGKGARGRFAPLPNPPMKVVQRKKRSGTVNSKSFVSKVLLRIKWKFELINAL